MCLSGLLFIENFAKCSMKINLEDYSIGLVLRFFDNNAGRIRKYFFIMSILYPFYIQVVLCNQ